MKISGIKKDARVALTGKWGKGACIILAYLAYAFVVGFVIGLFGDSLIGGLINLAYTIFQVPIIFGLSFAFIKLKRNEDVKAFDFINLGFSNFGKAWKIGLRQVLKLILPVIVLIISAVILAFGITASASALLLGESAASGSGLMIVGFILYIVSIIWLAVRSLLYALTTFIAYDNPNMNSLEVVNESERMMKGNRGKLFLLSLSFIGWEILTVFTLGIGYLWLLPYMLVAQVCFYEHLLGKKQESNTENNVEAITEM